MYTIQMGSANGKPCRATIKLPGRRLASLSLPGATGDPGGRPALRRDLLSGGQLDPAGPNAGRGRMDRYHQADGSARKLLLVYPLCRDVQQRLREAQPPCFSEAAAEADWA